jgi:Zn-dependent peptidase ImmA (M78 family)
MVPVSLDGETSLLNMVCVSKDHLDKNVGTNIRILISADTINIIMHIKDIVNESTLSDHEDELRDFVKWTCDKLKIKKMPRLEFQDSKESGDQKKTAHFDMQDGMIWIYTGNRNLADIMRSVAHELTHYKQDEKGQVSPDQSYPGSPIEQQADAVAGYLMKLYMDKEPGVLE